MALSVILDAVFSLAVFGLCLTGMIWRLTLKERGNYILEYESWCIIGEGIYYLIQSILGVINIFTQTTDSCLQNFIKYSLLRLIFAPVLAVPWLFFLGYHLEWFYFNTEARDKEFWCDLINHIIAPACVLVDSIIFKRKYAPSNLLDILIITGIYVAYCVLCLPFQDNEKVYLFASNKGCFISVMIVCYCIGIMMHFLYIIITKIRNCGSDKDKDEEKD